MTAEDAPISEAFDLIAQYAAQRGWMPIGWREWTVGPWKITVNGTHLPTNNIPAFHALVENEEYVALMLIHPFGGTVGGFKDTEANFIAAMQDAVRQFPGEAVRS